MQTNPESNAMQQCWYVLASELSRTKNRLLPIGVSRKQTQRSRSHGKRLRSWVPTRFSFIMLHRSKESRQGCWLTHGDWKTTRPLEHMPSSCFMNGPARCRCRGPLLIRTLAFLIPVWTSREECCRLSSLTICCPGTRRSPSTNAKRYYVGFELWQKVSGKE